MIDTDEELFYDWFSDRNKGKKMNRNKTKVKSRAHYILFAPDSPFTPKKEKTPKIYHRKTKHRNRDEW